MCVCVCVLGVYADKTGIEAAEMLLRNIRHNGCVDEFLQDQVRSPCCDGGVEHAVAMDASESARAAVPRPAIRALPLIIWNFSFPAHHFHGVGKRTVSDPNWGCDAAHTDRHSHRRTADSGAFTCLNWGWTGFNAGPVKARFISGQVQNNKV